MKAQSKYFELFSQFSANWEKYRPDLKLQFQKEEIQIHQNHSLYGEITNVINCLGGSLPYFINKNNIHWCTVAPEYSVLKQKVDDLYTWIMPSYGWLGKDDGYKSPDPSAKGLLKTLSTISPNNYFKWQSSITEYPKIEQKFNLQFQLEKNRPERKRIAQPSLYELRNRFQTALVTGDKNLAELVVNQIYSKQMDSAQNIQMMRIRFWYTFREFEKIKSFKYLNTLQGLPELPNVISECIREVLGEKDNKSHCVSNVLQKTKGETERKALSEEFIPVWQDNNLIGQNWEDWFNLVLADRKKVKLDLSIAKTWLDEKDPISPNSLNSKQIKYLSAKWDEIFIENEFRTENKTLIYQAIIIFLGDFVREDEFPRNGFQELYLSLLRLWADLNQRREDGHVLLELAKALFELGHEIDETKNIVESWWNTRPVPSRLTYALDAIELLSMEHPDQEAPANIWLSSSDLVKRNPELLLESEKKLWRSVGLRIGFDNGTISEYFPPIQDQKIDDSLTQLNGQKIAIVCMREKQVKEAVKMIEDRCEAKVFPVYSRVADTSTTTARSCDIVLFVWLACTHATFRAFDGFDKEKFCYVQGTGAGSIVRSLEHWINLEKNEEG